MRIFANKDLVQPFSDDSVLIQRPMPVAGRCYKVLSETLMNRKPRTMFRNKIEIVKEDVSLTGFYYK